ANSNPRPLKKVVLPLAGRREHTVSVVKSLDEIKCSRLQNEVLSKRWELPLPSEPMELLKNLLQRYPAACCKLVHHTSLGIWCGATPERLVRVKDRELQIMSLAGTLPYGNGEKPLWGTKELEEQHMVTEYIVERLRPYMDR